MGLLDLIVYVDAHPWLRDSINIGSVLATGALALAPLWGKHDGRARKWWQGRWLFLALLVFSLFACRLPVLFYPRPFQIDEAMLIAQALTYESHPMPWRDVDPTTSGPLNGYALLWGAPFGLQPCYLSARMTELFCELGMMAFLYLAGRRIAGEMPARIAILPVFVFLCFTSFIDYVHYTSEQVSLLMIGWAIYLLTRLRQTPGRLSILVTFGFILGLLPFAKLQSVLPATALGACALWLLIMRQSCPLPVALRRFSILTAAAILPGALMLSILAFAGALDDFWKSYIEMAMGYGVHFSSVGDDLGTKEFNIYEILSPRWDMTMPIYLMGGLGGTVGVCLICKGLQASRLARDWLLLSTLLALSMLATILFTNVGALHYHFYLLPALVLLTLASFRIVKTQVQRATSQSLGTFFRQAAIASSSIVVLLWVFVTWFNLEYDADPIPMSFFGFSAIPLLVLAAAFVLGATVQTNVHGARRRKVALAAALLPFFVAPALLVAFLPNPYRGYIGFFLKHPFTPMDQAILQLCPPGGRLAIWGWAPEYSAETGVPLGTRDFTTQWALSPCPLQDYYRQRYLRDMQANRPELFLEATGPDNFTFNDPKKYGIACFPELEKLISDQYRLIATIDGMRLFVRKHLDQAKALAPPAH